MIRNFFSITLLLIVNYSFGQNNWEPGYIIKHDNDTVYGFIDNRDSRSNSMRCFFRELETEDTETYYPDELIAYSYIDGKYFISKSIEYLESGNPVFLEFLINGELNIYHLQKDGSRFFAEKNGKIHELKNTEKIFSIDGKAYQKDNKEYVGVLNYLLEDADMQTDIKSSILKSKSLIKIAKKYHEQVCTKEKCIIYERKANIVDVHFGIHYGLSLNKLNFGNIIESDFAIGQFYGCRFEFNNLFEWIDNLNLIAEITYQRFTNYSLNNFSELPGSYVSYNNRDYYLTNNEYGIDFLGGQEKLDVNLKADAVKIPVIFKYSFLKGKNSPYIGTGISTIYILSQNKTLVLPKFFDEYNKSLPTFHIGLIGNLGNKIMFNKNHGVYLEFTFEFTQTTNINQMLRCKNNSFSFQCGYVF